MVRLDEGGTYVKRTVVPGSAALPGDVVLGINRILSISWTTFAGAVAVSPMIGTLGNIECSLDSWRKAGR